MSIFISDIRNNKNELEKKPTIAICSNLLRLYICAFTANLYSISQVLRHQNNIFLNKKKEFSVNSRNAQNSSKSFRSTSDENSRVE